MEIDPSAIIGSGATVAGVLLFMLISNIRGWWHSDKTMQRILDAHKVIIEEKDKQFFLIQTDRDFYRGLVLQTSTTQSKLVENQEKIVRIVERQVKPNGTTSASS